MEEFHVEIPNIDDKISELFEINLDLSEHLKNDLELFGDVYGDKSGAVFNKLDRTVTRFGSNCLKERLCRPVDDIEQLMDRQARLRKLISSRHERERISELLAEIDEDEIIWFWQPVSEDLQSLYDMVYWTLPMVEDRLNRMPWFLQATTMYSSVLSPGITILYPVFTILIPLVILKFTSIQIPVAPMMKMIVNMVFSKYTLSAFQAMSMRQKLMALGSIATYVVLYIQNIYSVCKNAYQINKVSGILHKKIGFIAKLARVGRELGVIESDKFQNDVFFQEPKWLNNKGLVLAEYFKFLEQKGEWIDVMYQIGQIDADLSICRLLMEEDYCFAHYLDQEEPQIDCEQIWHPFLDNPVKNDIDLDGNILITGPNAGGKSTFIKSVCLGVLLSQTWAISNATQFSVTPFRHIETYLHIPDCKGRESLFQAEMNRCKRQIDRLQKTDGKCFLIMDELFSSTNYVEGISAAYSICKRLSGFDNNLMMITTHYTDLSRLEDEGCLSNYMFTCAKEESGYNFSYRIAPGVSRDYIALDLLEENGFDAEVINEAKQLCEQIGSVNLITGEDAQ